MVWGKAGYKTLTVANATISLTGLPTSNFNQFLQHSIPNGSEGTEPRIKINNDSAGHANRMQRDGGNDSVANSRGDWVTSITDAPDDNFIVTYMSNFDGKEKIGMSFTVQNSGGTATPRRRVVTSTYTDGGTNAKVTQVDATDTATDKKGIGANFSALGDDVTPQAGRPTNVQVGSRFEETDTRKMYHYELSGGATYTPTIETADWTLTDNGGSATIANNELTIVANSNGDNPIATYDLGATISDTQWLMTFQVVYSGFQNSASGNGTKLGIGIGSSSSTTDLAGWNTSGMSFIEYDFRGHASTSVWQPYVSGGNSSGRTETAGSNYPDGGGYSATHYVKLYRLTSTTGKMEFYLQSDYSDTPVTLNVTMANVPSGLRYVFARSEYENVPDTNTFVISNFKIYNATNTVTTAANAWTEEGT